MEAPRGAREPTGTNGPTLNNKHPHQRVEQKHSEQSTAATTIRTTINPHPPPHTMWTPTKHGGTVLNTSLVVVTAPGKRPATFRTWKLSPAAPMVLQPIGCGRVGHRHNTPKQERTETGRFLAAPSIHTPGPRHRGPTHTHPQFDQPTPSNTRGPHSFIYSCMTVEGRQAAR